MGVARPEDGIFLRGRVAEVVVKLKTGMSMVDAVEMPERGEDIKVGALVSMPCGG